MAYFEAENEFRIYNTLQTKEIEEHKYYLSQRNHREMTLEEAFQDWCTKRYNGLTFAEIWSIKYFKHRTELIRNCGNKCEKGCLGFDRCPFSKEEIHKVLND